MDQIISVLCLLALPHVAICHTIKDAKSVSEAKETQFMITPAVHHAANTGIFVTPNKVVAHTYIAATISVQERAESDRDRFQAVDFKASSLLVNRNTSTSVIEQILTSSRKQFHSNSKVLQAFSSFGLTFSPKMAPQTKSKFSSFSQDIFSSSDVRNTISADDYRLNLREQSLEPSVDYLTSTGSKISSLQSTVVRDVEPTKSLKVANTDKQYRSVIIEVSESNTRGSSAIGKDNSEIVPSRSASFQFSSATEETSETNDLGSSANGNYYTEIVPSKSASFRYSSAIDETSESNGLRSSAKKKYYTEIVPSKSASFRYSSAIDKTSESNGLGSSANGNYFTEIEPTKSASFRYSSAIDETSKSNGLGSSAKRKYYTEIVPSKSASFRYSSAIDETSESNSLGYSTKGNYYTEVEPTKSVSFQYSSAIDETSESNGLGFSTKRKHHAKIELTQSLYFARTTQRYHTAQVTKIHNVAVSMKLLPTTKTKLIYSHVGQNQYKNVASSFITQSNIEKSLSTKRLYVQPAKSLNVIKTDRQYSPEFGATSKSELSFSTVASNYFYVSGPTKSVHGTATATEHSRSVDKKLENVTFTPRPFSAFFTESHTENTLATTSSTDKSPVTDESSTKNNCDCDREIEASERYRKFDFEFEKYLSVNKKHTKLANYLNTFLADHYPEFQRDIIAKKLLLDFTGQESITMVTRESRGKILTQTYPENGNIAKNYPSEYQYSKAIRYCSGNPEYCEYHEGHQDTNIVLISPHGGLLTPEGLIPRKNGCLTSHGCAYSDECEWTVSRFPDEKEHTNCTVDTTSNVDSNELALLLADAMQKQSGKRPHVILMKLKRSLIDVARFPEEGAFNDPLLRTVWNDFHTFIGIAKNRVQQRGMVFALHSHAETEKVVLGYAFENDHGVLKTSLNSLLKKLDLSLDEVTTGKTSLADSLKKRSITSQVLALSDKTVTDFTTAKSSLTKLYGSFYGGSMDSVTLSAPQEYCRRRDFVENLSGAVMDFMELNY